MRNILVLFSISVFVLSVGCEKKKQDAAVATPSAAQGAAGAAPAAAPAKVCPNGQPAKVVSGSCSGTWKIKREGGNAVCEFEWGPVVKCPTGMKPAGLEAACYGVTGKPVPAGTKVQSGDDCATSFGKFPLSPNYSLECC